MAGKWENQGPIRQADSRACVPRPADPASIRNSRTESDLGNRDPLVSKDVLDSEGETFHL